MDFQVEANVLLVDDRHENLVALQALLGDLGAQLVVASSGNEALRHLMDKDFAVILLDVQMPGMNGFETASLIRSRSKWSSTPIIFLTADLSSDASTFEGYRLGAVDFMYKPIVAEVVRTKVRVFVELFRKTEMLRAEIGLRNALEDALRRSEESFRAVIEHAPDGICVVHEARIVFANPALMMYLGVTEMEKLVGQPVETMVRAEHGAALRQLGAIAATAPGASALSEHLLLRQDGTSITAEISAMGIVFDGHASSLLMLRDVTERKQMQARLLEMAQTDHLTGLLIRRPGHEAMEREVSMAARYGTPLSFVLLDVDHFKRINDTFGHRVGDCTLQKIGEAILAQLRQGDLAIRWGGEELLIVLPHTDQAGGRAFAERIRKVISELRVEVAGAATVSAGVAQLQPGDNAEALVARADAKMYEAKNAGRNRVH